MKGKPVVALCYEEKIPVCQMNQKTKILQLTGVCTDSLVDQFYILKTSSSLLGLTRTRIILSEKNERWEIVERVDSQTIFAFTNSSVLFPLGKVGWYFEDGDCRDPGQDYRTLNLHLEVEQPGHFCCDDGACIDSELVCNNFPDCQAWIDPL